MMRARRCGSALMLVLWLVVILGAAGASFAAGTRGELDVVRNLRARSGARYAAESGVLLAHERLAEWLRRPLSTTERALLFSRLELELADLRDVALGDARVAVVVIDLNARLDLNQADEVMTREFLRQFTSDAQADAANAALQDWKDRDDDVRPGGAEAREYQRAGSLYKPANGPLHRLEELTRVLGLPESLAQAIAPFVTVDGDSRINLNSAPFEVLAALPAIGAEGAQAIIAERTRGRVFTSAGGVQELVRAREPTALTPALSRTVTLPSRLLIVSRGWQEGHPLTHEIQAVVAVSGQTMRLHSWRERDL